MERKNSYTRHVNATTAAARVAKVQNKRESLLLAKTSKDLSCESDGMLRSFFREKAKANSFLQKVHGTSPGVLESVKYNEQGGQATADDKLGILTGNASRVAMKGQRTRRISLDVNQTEETQKRIQEFIARDLPGQRTRPRSADQNGKLNARKIGGEVEEKGSPEGSNSQMMLNRACKRRVSSATPLRVRTRPSGICYSHSYSNLLPLPSVHVPNIGKKCSSEADFRLNSSYSSLRKIEFRRKLSTPTMVAQQISLEREKLYDVNFSKGPTDKTPKDKTVMARWSSTPVLTKKHSI